MRKWKEKVKWKMMSKKSIAQVERESEEIESGQKQ